MKRTSTLVILTAALVLMLALAAPAATVSCTGVAAWSPNSVSYAAGALVTYNGSEYKCLQSHTSQAGWDPADVPALWSLQGTCSSGGGGATPTPTPKSGTPTPTPKGATPTPTPAGGGGGTCWAAWSSTTAYNGGAQVSKNGENYQAAYWTQGNDPTVAGNSGPAGSGAYWIPEGSCSGSGGGGGGGATPTPTAKPTPTQGSGGGGPAPGFVFSPYKDITVDANWNTGEQQTTASGASEPVTQAMPNSTLTWAFATGDCTAENWAGITPALEASNVQQFVSAGKKYIISTGGAAGTFTCSSASGLVGFINRYNSSNLIGVDFDIESGQSSSAINSLVSAVKGAQSTFPNLRFSFTVASFGQSGMGQGVLNATGQAVMNAIKSTGLGGHWTINPMAFDFGSANPADCVVVGGACEMGQSAIGAMESVSQGWSIPYSNVEVTLEVPTDDGGAPFTMSDVNTLCGWVKSNGAAGVHFWSLDRDTGLTYTKAIPSACGTN